MVLLQQIKYFQAVVKNHSFSEAAQECHISQSAISQQIKALENELGFLLMERRNRTFILTPAGEYFYKKSLVLAADYERMCSEAAKIARGDGAVLKIGYPRSYSCKEFALALEEFTSKYPRVSIELFCGNHEELFSLLRNGAADLVLNDQRRAFSDEYVNLILSADPMYIEISAQNYIAKLPFVTASELKNIPCILVASKEQQIIEQEYYETIIGFQGEFFYVENLEEARLLVIAGKGFVPVEQHCKITDATSSICRIPLCRAGKYAIRNYCLFWKKDNSGYYVEEFADILKSKFE